MTDPQRLIKDILVAYSNLKQNLEGYDRRMNSDLQEWLMPLKKLLVTKNSALDRLSVHIAEQEKAVRVKVLEGVIKSCEYQRDLYPFKGESWTVIDNLVFQSTRN